MDSGRNMAPDSFDLGEPGRVAVRAYLTFHPCPSDNQQVLTFENQSLRTSAEVLAEKQFEQNCLALRQSQPDLDIPPRTITCEWVFGRDGSLTARDSDNRWISGSSLPLRVAGELMNRLRVQGVAAAMLCPTHAAQIRAALSRMTVSQALVVIHPSLDEISFHLHCEDFTTAIAAHRLFFVAGESWVEQLRNLYQRHGGFPTPTQFIRLPIIDATTADEVIAESQKLFAEVNQSRQRQAASVKWNPGNKIAVIAGSAFRLWEDKGHALLKLATSAVDGPILHIDPDDPLQAATTDLPARTADCAAILAADLCRADLPNLLDPRLPLITWTTTPRNPPTESLGANDQILIAGSPARAFASTPCESLAIIGDTSSLDCPKDLEEFSSQRLLWQTLLDEISARPFQVGNDPAGWLKKMIHRLNLNADDFPLPRYLVGLIYPAYAQALARMMIQHQLPLQLYGKGWDADFESHCKGVVETREQFELILSRPLGLVHVWPGVPNHAIESSGRPVVLPQQDERQFLAAARRVLSGDQGIPSFKDPLSTDLIRRALPRC